MQKINPCLWFDNEAQEAAQFYTSLFANSKIGRTLHYSEASAEASGQKEGSILTVEFDLEGQRIVALNGGPAFEFTPALSFFVWCESEEEINNLWKKLSQDGVVRMELDKYPWSEKYGWIADTYGVEWQLMLMKHKQKIAPAFLFVQELYGKGEEAVNFYTSLFADSKIESMVLDEEGKSIMHCVFSLAGQSFVLMEGKERHDFNFTSAFSLVVNCKDQKEVDEYWDKLSAGGSTEQCGWIKDKFGVSWQIVPTALVDMLNDPNPLKSEKVMSALLEMKKFDIEALKKAYEQ